VATYIESGGRLGDVAYISAEGILWDEERIKVWDKKTKNDKFMPLGPISKDLIRVWLQEFHPEPGATFGELGKEALALCWPVLKLKVT